MSGVYTEETLRALNKNQIIDLFLKTQEQANNYSFTNCRN